MPNESEDSIDKSFDKRSDDTEQEEKSKRGKKSRNPTKDLIKSSENTGRGKRTKKPTLKIQNFKESIVNKNNSNDEEDNQMMMELVDKSDWKYTRETGDKTYRPTYRFLKSDSKSPNQKSDLAIPSAFKQISGNSITGVNQNNKINNSVSSVHFTNSNISNNITQNQNINFPSLNSSFDKPFNSSPSTNGNLNNKNQSFSNKIVNDKKINNNLNNYNKLLNMKNNIQLSSTSITNTKNQNSTSLMENKNISNINLEFKKDQANHHKDNHILINTTNLKVNEIKKFESNTTFLNNNNNLNNNKRLSIANTKSKTGLPDDLLKYGKEVEMTNEEGEKECLTIIDISSPGEEEEEDDDGFDNNNKKNNTSHNSIDKSLNKYNTTIVSTNNTPKVNKNSKNNNFATKVTNNFADKSNNVASNKEEDVLNTSINTLSIPEDYSYSEPDDSDNNNNNKSISNNKNTSNYTLDLRKGNNRNTMNCLYNTTRQKINNIINENYQKNNANNVNNNNNNYQAYSNRNINYNISSSNLGIKNIVLYNKMNNNNTYNNYHNNYNNFNNNKNNFNNNNNKNNFNNSNNNAHTYNNRNMYTNTTTSTCRPPKRSMVIVNNTTTSSNMVILNNNNKTLCNNNNSLIVIGNNANDNTTANNNNNKMDNDNNYKASSDDSNVNTNIKNNIVQVQGDYKNINNNNNNTGVTSGSGGTFGSKSIIGINTLNNRPIYLNHSKLEKSNEHILNYQKYNENSNSSRVCTEMSTSKSNTSVVKADSKKKVNRKRRRPGGTNIYEEEQEELKRSNQFSKFLKKPERPEVSNSDVLQGPSVRKDKTGWWKVIDPFPQTECNKCPILANQSSTYHSQLSSRLSKNLPWLCVFCNKGTCHKSLGDLFGPYFFDHKHLNIPLSPTLNQPAKHSSILPTDNKQKTTKHSPQLPKELWCHGECAIWSPGIFVAEGRLQGLEETAFIAMTHVCLSVCLFVYFYFILVNASYR